MLTRILLVLFFAGLRAFCLAEGGSITVSTEGEKFALNEKIRVKVVNGMDVSVFTAAASDKPHLSIMNFEKKASVGWDALPLRCRQPSCKEDQPAPLPVEIKPRASVEFVWHPKIYEDGKYVSPGPGTYRLTIIYQVKKKSDPKVWNWTTVRSNTFILEN